MNRDDVYAKLLIEQGVNVGQGQTLVINASPIHHDFVVKLVENAYKKGAKQVVVDWSSDELTRQHYLNQDKETLTNISPWKVEKYKELVSENLCKLALRAPNPGLLDDVDSSLMNEVAKKSMKKLKFYSDYSMNNEGQWLVAAYPSYAWAEKVFPNLDKQQAYDKLYEYIMKACKVDENADDNWKKHNERLAAQNKILNDYNFKSLVFKNNKGTDIEVGLVDNHIWCGGMDEAQNGRTFNPNMPTEESFTAPHREKVNGIVYNTLPLNYRGQLIDDFWLEFKDGEVINFDAKSGKEALENLLNSDENSKRIGEIALVPNSSPISQLQTLFYNTLFDENASCHMALGRAYPLIPNGETMSTEELKEKGINGSMVHVDFMFGSPDMQVTGIKENGDEVVIMKDGEFNF